MEICACVSFYLAPSVLPHAKLCLLVKKKEKFAERCTVPAVPGFVESVAGTLQRPLLVSACIP